MFYVAQENPETLCTHLSPRNGTAPATVGNEQPTIKPLNHGLGRRWSVMTCQSGELLKDHF